jgi:dihydroorotate dehydrogenase (NAD+) catalytic subunit
MDLSTKIGALVLPNPVGVASGTFGFGEEYGALIPLSSLGALYTKAVTPEPRAGNEPPRLIETPSGLINSIGLANVGLKRFIDEKIPFLARAGCPVILNVAGACAEDYRVVVEETNRFDTIAAYEINISCPNVKKGGLTFGTDPATVEELTRDLKSRTGKPVIPKLTPNVTDIGEIAKAAENGGADAVSCINTVRGMVIDTKTRKPVLKAVTGGLSGPAIRPVGVAAVYRVGQCVRIPIIGLGGIMSADDAVQYLLAGASAIQVGTGLFIDPRLPLAVLDGITMYMEQAGFNRISDFHGHF